MGWTGDDSGFQLIFGDKLRREKERRVRLHTHGSNTGGNSGTGRQPLDPDALDSGGLRDSCCCLLLSLHDDRDDRLMEFDQLVFSFYGPQTANLSGSLEVNDVSRTGNQVR
jgi:hypothetical protein